jgi:hypothetical protein
VRRLAALPLVAACGLTAAVGLSGCRRDRAPALDPGTGPAGVVDVVATAVPVTSDGTGLVVDEVRLQGGTPLLVEARVRCVEPAGCRGEVVLSLDLASPTGPLRTPLRRAVVLAEGESATLRRQIRSAPTVRGVAGGWLSLTPAAAPRDAETEIYQ